MSFDAIAFGRRIAAARAELGLKPKQVAQQLGVSGETINRWERGGLTKQPSKAHLKLLAEILGRQEDWLLEGTPAPADGDVGDGPTDEVLAELRALDRKLDTTTVDLERRLERIEDGLSRLEAAVQPIER